MKNVKTSKFWEKVFWEDGFLDIGVNGGDDFGLYELSYLLSNFLSK